MRYSENKINEMLEYIYPTLANEIEKLKTMM